MRYAAAGGSPEEAGGARLKNDALALLTPSASRHLAAPHRLAHLKPLELGVIQIQRLVVACPTMR